MSELSEEDDDEDEDEDEDDDDDEEDDEELELLLCFFCCWPELSISGFPFTAVFPLVDSSRCRSWTDDGDGPRSPGGSLLCDWLVVGDLERAGSSRE